MTKIKCRTCNEFISKYAAGSEYIRNSDNSVKECRACKRIRLNKDKTDEAINFGFTKNQIHEITKYFYNDNGMYINEISEKLDISIESCVSLYKKLKITKKVFIVDNCEYCKEKHNFRINDYINSNYHYCSHQCYYNDKSNKMQKGEASPFYNRIKFNCSFCNKEILIPPNRMKILNKNNENHNFCSQECYWKFRSEYYVGERATNKNMKISKEELKRRRIRSSELTKKLCRLDTTIQKRINEILDDLNIQYERERSFKYYAVDNYLICENLIIEVMGDYWHVNPTIYNKEKRKINDIQVRDIIKDKKKHTYIKKYYDIEVLYLWETDINKNPELCKKLIMHYIENLGKIENYQSFNYKINEKNILEINTDIIYPYFLLDKKYFKEIKK